MSIKNSSYLIPVAIIIAGLVIAGTVIYIKQEKEPFLGNETPSEVKDEEHIRGDQNASVTVVEFSDFQCPYCTRFHQTMNQVMENYQGKVKWAYKHFPLNFHPHAQPAAEASECAAEQGKFWEFADGLFENQSRLGNSLYQKLAGNLGLNLEQFNQCVSSQKYKDKVEKDYKEGISKGVKGTPASFINDEFVSGAQPYEKIKEIIDKNL